MDTTFIVQNFKFTCQICKLNNTILQKFIVRIRKLRQHSCVYKETYEDNHEIKMNKLSDINVKWEDRRIILKSCLNESQTKSVCKFTLWVDNANVCKILLLFSSCNIFC